MSKSRPFGNSCLKNGESQSPGLKNSSSLGHKEYAERLSHLRNEVDRLKRNHPILTESRKTKYVNEELPGYTENVPRAACRNMNCNNVIDVPRGHNEILSSQAVYIDNLQQQDTEKVLQKLRIDLKRKQTSVDLLKSEKSRMLQKAEESEAIYFKQKMSFLEEIEELKKANSEYHEKFIEQEHNLEEMRKNNQKVEEELYSLKVHAEESENELSAEKKTTDVLKEDKRELQKSLIEATMNLEVRGAIDHQEAIKILKEEILELHVQVTTAGRIAEHEKVLRSHLSKENDALIKRHASMEAELAEAKAKLLEEKTTRCSLEEIHLKTIVDSSSSKSEIGAQKCEISSLKQQLRAGKERILQLSSQFSEEQRHRSKEQQNILFLERKLDQRKVKAESKEQENTQLLSDNVSLRDKVMRLTELLREREAEVAALNKKVAEMQVSVEEFVENTKAANRVEGKRWMQLTELAQGIQMLSKDAIHDKDV